MKKYCLLGLLVSFIAVDAHALTCSAISVDCSAYGYSENVSDCPNDYIACPFDTTKGTCIHHVQIGSIGLFPKDPNGTTTGAYKGWLYLDGKYYSQAMYPDLYAVLGTTYGGGGSVFRVPDYRYDYLKVANSASTSALTRGGEGLPNIKATWRSLFEDQDLTHSEYKYNNLVVSKAYDDVSGTEFEGRKSGGGGYMRRTFDASKYNPIYSGSSVTPVHTPVYGYIYAGRKISSASSSKSVPSGCAQGYYYYTDGTCSATRNTSKTLRGIVYSYYSSTNYAAVKFIWGGSSSTFSYTAAKAACKKMHYDAEMYPPGSVTTTLSKASGFTSTVSPVSPISTTITYWSSEDYGYKCTSTTSCSTGVSSPSSAYYYCSAYDYFY